MTDILPISQAELLDAACRSVSELVSAVDRPLTRLAVRTLRFRPGSAVATLLALAAGVMILMAMGALVESGLRYEPAPVRYGAAGVQAEFGLARSFPKGSPPCNRRARSACAM